MLNVENVYCNNVSNRRSDRECQCALLNIVILVRTQYDMEIAQKDVDLPLREYCHE